jgi:hypothetical protein
MCSSALPVGGELGFMKLGPLGEQAQRSAWESPDDEPGLDLDDHLMVSVPGVNVRGIVVAVIYEHDDAVEPAEYGHDEVGRSRMDPVSVRPVGCRMPERAALAAP